MSSEADETTPTGPDCPSCGEPWLRGTNLPGRYRCLYCLHRFELRSECPHCGRVTKTTSDGVCAECWGSKGGRGMAWRRQRPRGSSLLGDVLRLFWFV